MQNYHVQWTGQYYIAYELSKRGYVASLTIGNAPEIDILARSPKGTPFSVEVKTMQKPNVWRVDDPVENTNYWFFVLLNEGDPEVAIMTGEEVKQEWENCYQHMCELHPDWKEQRTGHNIGIHHSQIKKYLDRGWKILPP